ncbi:MAG: alanine--tRNA ligase [Bacteroidota bacterium]
MNIATIRRKFITFFEQKGHTFVPGVPIIQQDNPSLLFINAGMNPFSNIFLGNEKPSVPRAVNSQPCLRVTGKHNDLEEVGIDTYHHTLFEMLGNWSFGDYFKKEAIANAWELITEIYKIPKENIYVTVFEGDKEDGLDADKETFDLWKNYVSDKHILYANKKDNFWEMGATGPCGPCTEIHVDLRNKKEKKAQPGHTLVNNDHPQVIEIWNLVFIQYHRQANGNLSPLPKCHVDTGMGLERLAMVLQGKKATYDTDAFQPLIQAIATLADTAYGQNEKKDIALRVVADHLRAITFAIADGASPSNQQAGYVIRRLLRRAVRYAYQYLDLKEPFLHTLVPTLIENMQDAYPQLATQQPLLSKLILQEETNFLRTLAQGLRRFEHFRTHLQNKTLGGKEAFQLYDTYGFPLDLTVLLAQEQGLHVDTEGFQQEMTQQKNRSKQVAEKNYGDWQKVHSDKKKSHFVGYDQLDTMSLLLTYRMVQQQEKTQYQLVLDQTPFYPQGGGQVGDTGYLLFGNEKVAILDTRKEEGMIIHISNHLPKDLHSPIQAVIDQEKRRSTANNHTATHLLEAALKHILGKHVAQRGSYLDAQRLRFDFTHPEKLTTEQCEAIEALVNEKIRANIPRIEERDLPFSQAQAKGATTLIGETYGEKVRVITFDPSFSIALCGGTHANATGQLGFFKIISTASVAAGIRRIEAVTAQEAEKWVRHTHRKMTQIATLLRQPQDVVHAIENLQKAYKKEQKTVAQYQKKALQQIRQTIESHIQTKGKQTIAITQIEIETVEDFRKVMRPLHQQYDNLILILAAKVDNKPYIATMVSDPSHDAKKIAQELSAPIQGQVNGQATFAIIHGTKIEGLSKAMAAAKKKYLS